MNLSHLIKNQLHENPELSFEQFMHMALYHPEYGYYTGALPKLGQWGDFITAPELSTLFGKTLANQCYQILTSLLNPAILEFGAGTGKLCVDILCHLETLGLLPEHYYILEVSGHLKATQQQLIADTIPHLAHKITWLTGWPQLPFEGIIIANEVLDAMPVHRFLKTEQEILESFVILNPEDAFEESFRRCTHSRLEEYLQEILPPLPLPYQSEVNLFVDDWIQQCSASLKAGAMLIIDYGFPRHEYYHPDRKHGTLMCHYRHQSHPNPFIHVGEQDITAHVDFTQVAEAALKAGLQVNGFTNQAAFLLSNGLLDLVDQQDNRQQLNDLRAVKLLTHPSEMGELFKVMALTKKLDIDLHGFELFDKRASL